VRRAGDKSDGAGPADAARTAASMLGIEARAYFGGKTWPEIVPALSNCWRRNYAAKHGDWALVAPVAYDAWSYKGAREVLTPDPSYGEVAS